MSSYLLIGLGGALGAMARVGLTGFMPSHILNIPVKILCINVLGCLAIGLLSEVMAHYWSASINMRHFLIQGFLGGFTTFSAFALEYGLLHERGTHLTAIFFAAISVFLSIVAFFLGVKLIKFLPY